MIADPYDPQHPTAASHAALWAHRPAFVLSCVTLHETEAQARAVAVATAHRTPLAPGVWPLNGPTDAARFAVGPVYVAARTQRIHALARDVVTYYVLRRRRADEPTASADPTWTVQAADVAVTEAPPAPWWPFTRVGHRTMQADSNTLGAGIITWRGPLFGETITFTTRPRAVDAHAPFRVSANARIGDTTEHPQFIDVCVHHPLVEAARAALAELVHAQDARPAIVRCVGERVRGWSSRHNAARDVAADAPRPVFRAGPVAEPGAGTADTEGSTRDAPSRGARSRDGGWDGRTP